MTDSIIKIRKATEADLEELLDIFTGTIYSTCKNDYSKSQLDAWAASAEKKDLWLQRIRNQYFIVAEQNNMITGFASLEKGEYIDVLFIHKDHIKKGIATLLYKKIEQEAIKNNREVIITHASKTAVPFFTSQGFKIVKENLNILKGIEIINYRMKKDL